MKEASRLLGEFPPPDLAQWRQEVERLLKGAPFDDRMFTRLAEGFAVGPLYTTADTTDIPWREVLPGQAPFVRGNHAAGYHGAPWLVAQECRTPTCEDFNNNVREALRKGQTAVRLVLDQAGMNGQDPDQVAHLEVGQDGTSVCSLADLATALDGIDLARWPLQIEAGAAALPLAAMLVALIRRRQGDPGDLRGCLGSDPWTGLARLGHINGEPEQILDETAVLVRWAADHAPQVRTLPVFESAWHEGGADLALSLGLSLSAAVATLRAMEARGLAPDVVAPRFQFHVSIGTDFFLEMAKLRVLRLLWSRILTASGVAPDRTATFIHARTARRAESGLDPHVNLLRATTAAMSAVLGGADSLHVAPFDAVLGRPDDVSRRIARNLQLVLAHECHFDQVADPAGGSWYVENLTRELAAAAWRRFQATEDAGGLPRALASGWVQDEIAKAAAVRANRLATRREVMVGVNAFPAAAGRPVPADTADAAALHRRRSATLSRQRTSATQEAHMLVLARLEKIMDSAEDGLFESLVEAAEAGATLGEFVGVMRASSRPVMEVTPVPLRRDAEPFELLRGRVEALAGRSPAAARVHVLCLGDVAGYLPRLEFARGFFAVGGFAVTGDRWHGKADAAVAAAAAAGDGTVVLVGLDATYAESAAAVAKGLRALPQPPRVYLAGAAGEAEAAWRAAGIDAFIVRYSDVLAVLGDLLDELEDRS